ncbi:MAG: hypothetical protein IPL43_10900 [Micropruina sp.]|nr:hypothetical protein [Micropruina sp.]
MLITGDVTAAERRFRLTKYFIQILAGITRTAIVVDPDGDLAIGTEHRIPFALGAQDHQVDVIVLSPLAPLLEVVLEAPDGTLVDASLGLPTVEHQQNLDDVLYRLTLPLDPKIAVEGEWTAVLRLPKDALDKFEGREDLQARFSQLRQTGTLPYSLIVQSYSDVHLEAEIRPTLCLAGDKLEFLASLVAFGQPFTGRARVTARVIEPSGIETLVPLDPQGDGHYAGVLATSEPGVYVVRFLAMGRGRGVSRFQREELRTAVAYKGEIPTSEGTSEDDKTREGDNQRRDWRQKERNPMGELHHEPRRKPRPEDFGLLVQPDVEPVPLHDHPGEGVDHRLDGAVEADAHDEHADHDAMFFRAWRRTEAGDIVELEPGQIKRDTSGFQDGRDPGIGPDPTNLNRPKPEIEEHPEGGHPH